MKRKLLHIYSGIFLVLFIAFCTKSIAQTASDDFNNEDLYYKGLTEFNKNDYKKAAIYLYAYIQRKPDAMRSNGTFKQRVQEAFKYSVDRTATGISASTKSDGYDKCKCAALSADNNSRPKLQASVSKPNKSISPAGHWRGNDSMTYYFKQVGNEVWGHGQRNDSTKTLIMMLHGTISGDKIHAKWTDTRSGNAGQSGEIILQIVTEKRLKAVGNPNSSIAKEWTRNSSIQKVHTHVKINAKQIK